MCNQSRHAPFRSTPRSHSSPHVASACSRVAVTQGRRSEALRTHLVLQGAKPCHATVRNPPNPSNPVRIVRVHRRYRDSFAPLNCKRILQVSRSLTQSRSMRALCCDDASVAACMKRMGVNRLKRSSWSRISPNKTSCYAATMTSRNRRAMRYRRSIPYLWNGSQVALWCYSRHTIRFATNSADHRKRANPWRNACHRFLRSLPDCPSRRDTLRD
jgi:hypothetical protein